MGASEFAGCTHFLYGGKRGVAEDLRDNLLRRFPWARIVGTHTPPFRDLTLEEEDSLAARIHALKPDMIWVGISTPKQERFMMRFLPLLDSTLMFGVGAAFDFHTGRIQDAPRWVKRAGLQWLHRLIQDPRRLFWRYCRNNSAFLWHIALELYRDARLSAGETGSTLLQTASNCARTVDLAAKMPFSQRVISSVPKRVAEILGASSEVGEARSSGAKAHIDCAGFMRGLKPPPPSAV